ncbi:MAG: DNA replication and repair protein RecF [Firmicutes bacterium]|nr:DNA replication and repair protein RecF [Bacillota bacterium]
MTVQRLELVNYRSYSHIQLTFDAQLNVFLGKNGAGKTNLAEAIHFLSLARSFRTSDDQDLLQKGQPFAKVKAVIDLQGRKQTLEIVITHQGKKILLNQKPVKKLSELSKVIHVLFFEPRDVMLFDDLPKVRRKFLDTHISKHQEGYLQQLSQYEALLNERNLLLKSAQPNRQHLAVLTKQLIEASYPIVVARHSYIENINKVISKITSVVKGSPIDIKLQYVPYVNPKQDFFKEASLLFASKLEDDIRKKTTQLGTQREDFVAIYNQQTIANYGSQGENRLAAIALKIAPYFLVEDQALRPIIVLDDVLSELDEPTQKRLLQFLQKLQQVFITTTHMLDSPAAIYDIQNSHIQRRA